MLNKLWWVYVLLIFLLTINYITETIPYRFNFICSSKSDFSVMCYNVKCSDSHYKENQIEIAKTNYYETIQQITFVSFSGHINHYAVFVY